jgi:hypothetical protein
MLSVQASKYATIETIFLPWDVVWALLLPAIIVEGLPSFILALLLQPIIYNL